MNRNFNNPDFTVSTNLAYVIGVLSGDGFTLKSPKGDMLVLQVNSEPFALSFQSALQHMGLPSRIRDLRGYVGCNTNYRVTAYSQAFVDWYRAMSLIEIKDLLQLPVNDPLFYAFLRGFYESDGCFYERTHPKKYIKISLTKGRLDLMLLVERCLKDRYFHPQLSQRIPKPTIIKGQVANFTKPVYLIELQRRQEVLTLLDNMQPCIKH